MSTVNGNTLKDSEKQLDDHQQCDNCSRIRIIDKEPRFGNGGPLALFAFSLTTFCLSLINLQARKVTHPDVIIGLALFYGGIAQMLGGIWEFANGHTFQATAFCSYGAFWLAYATILIPSFNVKKSYSSAEELDSALGIFNFCWFALTVLLTSLTLRSNASIFIVFSLLSTTFFFLGLGHLVASSLIRVAGVMGLLTAVAAAYAGYNELVTPENSWWAPHFGKFPWSPNPNKP